MQKEESRFAENTIFEGMTSLRAVLFAMENALDDRKILEVFFDCDKQADKKKELGYLRAMGQKYAFPVTGTNAAHLDQMTVGSTHGGIVALCSSRTIPALNTQTIRRHGFYAMIEGIEDPYNFGYAIRSLYACGVDGIVLSPRNWMRAAGVVCRSSAGASERLPLFISTGESAADLFREMGYTVCCAGIRDAVSSFSADLHLPLFMVVGGEKRGISRAVLDKADLVVRIEYGRQFSGSLSAASAASMLAYEVLRQNPDMHRETSGY